MRLLLAMIFIGALALPAAAGYSQYCRSYKLSPAKPSVSFVATSTASVLNNGPGNVIIKEFGKKLGKMEGAIYDGYQGKRLRVALTSGSKSAVVEICKF